ncbi:hypothetical protein N9I19_15760 [Peribacillus sp. CSMR9]|nr:hypothetical protein [Peribacillus sp. CSMR9]
MKRLKLGLDPYLYIKQKINLKVLYSCVSKLSEDENYENEESPKNGLKGGGNGYLTVTTT